jgi:hypothetical protein
MSEKILLATDETVKLAKGLNKEIIVMSVVGFDQSKKMFCIAQVLLKGDKSGKAA